MKSAINLSDIQELTPSQLQEITGGDIDIDIFNHHILAHIETDINFYLHF
jgi:hypothetical protein